MIEEVEIESIDENFLEEKAYDISILSNENFLNNEHNYIANNIVVHNSHAAGFIISPIPMNRICPLHVTKRGKAMDVASQFTMEDVESLGLIKMDLLGLSTETAIARTTETVKDKYNIELDWDIIKRDDKKTFKLLSSGKTMKKAIQQIPKV